MDPEPTELGAESVALRPDLLRVRGSGAPDHPDRPRYRPGGGDAWRDPWPMYAALRDRDPVHHVADGDHWVLSRFAHVWAAARDPATFSSTGGLTTVADEREKTGLADDAIPLVMMDPPEHTVVRRPVGRGLTPRRVARLEDEIRVEARVAAQRMRDLGNCDAVEQMFGPLPGAVVARLLGVGAEDRPQLQRWTDVIVSSGAGLGGGDAVRRTVQELAGFFAERIEAQRHDPDDDVFGMLLAAAAQGAPVSDVQIYGVAFTMVAGGNDTMTGLLGGAAEWLTRRRDQRRLLLEDPTLIPGAVEEVLRLSSPLQAIARTATRDVELLGRVIPEGRKVLLLYASANRDPREFGPDADDMDVRRSIPRSMAFGSGAHHCVGAAVARLQARVALEELLLACPDFEIDLDAIRWAEGSTVRRPVTMAFHAG